MPRVQNHHPGQVLGSILALILSYLVGLFSLAVISGFYMAGIASFVFAVGLLFGMPLLVTVIAVRLIFDDHIARHLVIWCLASPVLIAAFWVLSGYVFIVQNHELNFVSFVQRKAVWSRAMPAFVVAAISSFTYFLLEKGLGACGARSGSSRS